MNFAAAAAFWLRRSPEVTDGTGYKAFCPGGEPSHTTRCSPIGCSGTARARPDPVSSSNSGLSAFAIQLVLRRSVELARVSIASCTPLRLHRVAGTARHQARRYHRAGVPHLRDFPVHPVASRTRFLAEAQKLPLGTQPIHQPAQRLPVLANRAKRCRCSTISRWTRHRNRILVDIQTNKPATLHLAILLGNNAGYCGRIAIALRYFIRPESRVSTKCLETPSCMMYTIERGREIDWSRTCSLVFAIWKRIYDDALGAQRKGPTQGPLQLSPTLFRGTGGLF